MDPLSVLREFASEQKLDQVVVDGTRIEFGDQYIFPKTALTGYKRHSSDQTYELYTLVYYLKQPPNTPWLAYVRLARENGVPQVAFPDRKELMDYLTGKVERSEKIQLMAPELILPAATEEQNFEPSLKKARLDPQDAGGQGERGETGRGPIMGRERSLRDRNSQMSVPAKSFKDVLQIIEMAENEYRRREKQRKAQPPPQEQKKLPIMPSGRYDRPAPAADRVRAGSGSAPPPPPPPPSGHPPPPPTSKPPAATSAAAKHSLAEKQRRPSSSSSVPAKRKPPDMRPILIVPAAPSAKITMLNVKDFLEQGVYKSSEALRKEGTKKDSRITIMRSIGRTKPRPYEVTDKTPTHKHEWERVVAVFVTGATWQFKGFPDPEAANGDMAKTFHRFLGVHVGMKNEIMADNLKTWNIKSYKLHPDNRHGDKSVVMDIFGSIDKFMANKGKSCRVAY